LTHALASPTDSTLLDLKVASPTSPSLWRTKTLLPIEIELAENLAGLMYLLSTSIASNSVFLTYCTLTCSGDSALNTTPITYKSETDSGINQDGKNTLSNRAGTKCLFMPGRPQFATLTGAAASAATDGWWGDSPGALGAGGDLDPDAPEADAPEADAPEADAPEADAPETDAPETDAPDDDGAILGIFPKTKQFNFN
jgi:hypothetical protein